MLTILEWSNVWEDMAKRAMGKRNGTEILSRCFDLMTSVPNMTIGKAIYRAKRDVACKRDFGRKSQRATMLECAELPIDASVCRDERLDQIRELISEVSAPYADILTAYVQGSSMTDIAESIGVHVSTVSRTIAAFISEAKAQLA